MTIKGKDPIEFLDNIEKADLFSYLFLQGPITDRESHLLDHLSDVIIFSENEKENESLVEENILPMIKRCETNKYENNFPLFIHCANRKDRKKWEESI